MMGGMSHPRPLRPSPPVDFPVYGLAQSWAGARWLESFGDAIGDPVRWVSLGHLGPDGGALVLVETYSRARTDAMAASSGRPPLADVAERAATTLVDLTLPALSVPRPDGMLRALVTHADERGAGYAAWSPVSWRVDGAAVTARAWRFAGGWAAVSDAVDDVYLAVASVGADPDGLSLGLIADGGAYHYRLGQPLHPDVMASSRAARPGGEQLPWPKPAQWHDDQLRALQGRA
jgi:hypothetical protein